MSNRSSYSFEVAKMGVVWVASFTFLGISAIGTTQEEAIKGVMEAFATHAVAEQAGS